MSSDERSVEPTPKPNKRIILTSSTDTVALKQLIPEDAAEYFTRIQEDPAHLSQRHGDHVDETAEKYSKVEDVLDSIVNPKNKERIRFGIWDGDVFVGSNNITPKGEGRAELGTWVGGNHKGHGYAARARALLTDFAFNTLKLDEVFSAIAIGNEASRKSVERSGFELTGEVEGHWIYTLHRPKTTNTSK